MNHFLKSLLAGFLFLFASEGICQNTTQNDVLEKLIESLAEQNENELDYPDVLEDFQQLLTKPVNVNTATGKEFKKMYFLSENQIQNLLEYRKNTGQILSIYELQLIPGFSYELIRNIEAFIHFETPLSKKASHLQRPRHRILLRSERKLEKEAGYKENGFNSSFLGNPWKYYSRYQYESGNKLSAGFTAEKDKGEAFFKDQNSNGFDFYSAFVQYKTSGILQQINLGDFQVKFGQGLNLWAGLPGSKNSFTTNKSYKLQGIRSYRSTDENQFMRGASVLIRPAKNTELALFVSSKKRDGSLQTTNSKSFVSSIVNTGLHRTRNEMDKKHVLREQMAGAYFIFDVPQLEIGTSFLTYNFSPEIQPKKQAYNFYNFKGKQNYNLSISYKTQFRSLSFYGEAVRSKSGGMAFLQGVNVLAHSQLNFELIYRNYSKNYHALYAVAFGEQGNTRNEEGFYMGVEFHPFPKWTVKAYYDLFRFPWLRYTADSPSEGHEYFSQIEYTPNQAVSAYFRYRQESKSGNNGSQNNNGLVENSKKQYRMHVSAKIDAHWEIRNRLELTSFHNKSSQENGFLIYQDLIYHFSKLPFKLSCRYALFDTDSYNTRIYAYENDILYAYSVPAYYSKGSRFYVNGSYKFSRKCTFYARYSQTRYSNTDQIGSGASAIEGNTKSEIKFQFMLRF